MEKACTECDRLWKELQAEAKVSKDSQTALAEQGQELDMVRVCCRGLSLVHARRAMPCFLCRLWRALMTSLGGCTPSWRASLGSSGAQSVKAPLRL